MRNHPLNSRLNPIHLVFGFCFLFWGYLFFTTRMELIFDAISYEWAGKLLYEKGWKEFFLTGPQREPVYLSLIAFSLWLGDVFSIHYHWILKFIQILILFISQLLSLQILRRLNVSPIVQALTIFYLGISPALINSTFSLFSEIATYPLALAIVLAGARSWETIHSSSKLKIVINGIGLGILFMIMTLTKAIFTYILFLYLIPFIYLSFRSLQKKNTLILSNAILFIFCVLLTFHIPIKQYKLLNKKHNGHYVITDRVWLVYGNTHRRTQLMTKEKWIAALSYIPGEGVCHKTSSPNDCFFWSIAPADGFAHIKIVELENQGVPKNQLDRKLLEAAKKKILEHPFQYTTFYLLESLKIFFWESTQIGAVQYPPWLKNAYDSPIIQNAARLILSLLTIFSFFYTMKLLWKERRNIASLQNQQNNPKTLCLLIIVLIIGFTVLHSLIEIIPRYIFTIAPLFLILIGFSFNHYFLRNHGHKT